MYMFSRRRLVDDTYRSSIKYLMGIVTSYRSGIRPFFLSSLFPLSSLTHSFFSSFLPPGPRSHARRLFDAATVADPGHSAAWHGWGMLEMREDNLMKARELFLRGLREAAGGDGNAYLYHSLGLLCKRMGRTGEARQWFAEGPFPVRGYTYTYSLAHAP